MDKQKQIEEMAKDMLNYAMEYYPKDMRAFTETTLREHFYLLYLGYAQYLIKAGYRKIPENAVVLTREEYKEYQRLKVDNNHIFKVLEDSVADEKQARKETAEKFAEKLKEKRFDEYSPEGKCYECVAVSDIDETCKEFTEGEYGESLCEE